jgi:hypothetical protein
MQRRTTPETRAGLRQLSMVSFHKVSCRPVCRDNPAYNRPVCSRPKLIPSASYSLDFIALGWANLTALAVTSSSNHRVQHDSLLHEAQALLFISSTYLLCYVCLLVLAHQPDFEFEAACRVAISCLHCHDLTLSGSSYRSLRLVRSLSMSRRITRSTLSDCTLCIVRFLSVLRWVHSFSPAPPTLLLRFCVSPSAIFIVVSLAMRKICRSCLNITLHSAPQAEQGPRSRRLSVSCWD